MKICLLIRMCFDLAIMFIMKKNKILFCVSTNVADDYYDRSIVL